MTDAEVSVRPASAEDYPAVEHLLSLEQGIHHEGMPLHLKKMARPSIGKEKFMAALTDQKKAFLVAEKGAKVVGVLECFVDEVSETPQRNPLTTVFIHEVIVEEAYRGRGIGTLLMERAEQWAKNKGVAEIRLNVWGFNDEVEKWYRSLGYEKLVNLMYKRI